jgi:hypothetical protein
MGTPSHANSSSPARKWRWQFRLRTLLLFTTGTALILGFLVPYLDKRGERRSVAELKDAGCSVFYDYEWDVGQERWLEGRGPTAPAWIRRVAGDDAFAHPVDVLCTPKTPDRVLRSIGRLGSLASARLRGLSPASEPFRAISTLSHLETIELDGRIDLHDLADISPMPHVTTLRLSDTCLSDSACAAIVARFPELRVLEIFGGLDGCPEFTEVGLSAIRQLPHLRRLSVRECVNVWPAAVNGFSGSTELEELELEIRMDAAGDPLVQRARIHDCPSLERLVIERAILFGGASTNNWSLSVEGVPHIKELRIWGVCKLQIDASPSLEKLGLVQDCNVSAPEFSGIVACSPLVDVDLCAFDGDLMATLDSLRKVSSLRTLVLRRTALTESAVEAIGSLRQLENLDIRDNKNVDDRCLQHLGQLANLRSLRLSGTRVTEAGIRHLERVIPGVRCIAVDPQGPMGKGGN